jgi:predicted aldo/keto reductase-like oxidoreductase
MEYRVDPRTGKNVSLLGFGAMRLKSSGVNVDLDAATEQFKYAIDNGINYFDTAYLYGKGLNEKAVGIVLEKLGCRENVFLSTKMNRMVINSRKDMDVMFEDQLKSLRTDYIDYYFLHNVISYEDVVKLIDVGLFDFIDEKKSKGQIVNMGFSFHGSFDDFRKILDLYDWDVTLLQYNYLDSNIQAGINGIRLANERDMSVIIMEPLKGGLLAGKMPSAIENLIASSNTSRSMVDLAFSWIFDNPEITCVLSGMNSMEMLEENINITNNHLENPLNDDEKELINSMEDIFLDLNEINCTGCNYCMPCPQQINIPDIFKLFNDKNLFPENSSYGIHHNFILYSGNILGVTGDAHDASLCVDCGLCKSKCPQQLDIPHLIRNVDNTFHGKYIRPFIPFVKRLMNVFL